MVIESTLRAYGNGVLWNLLKLRHSLVICTKYLDDEAYRELQISLAANPERGDVMPGTGGFRKARFHDPKRQKGRRGGLRVIYYYFAADQQIWLMTLYDKNEADDLSTVQKRQLRLAIETEIKRRAQSARRKNL